MAAAIYAAALSMVSRPAIFLDDAAISFRYAERIATGHGFTYNDHERVLGASNPFYTLVLAGPIAFGVSADDAAAAIGAVSYVAGVGLAVLLAATYGGAVGGLSSAIILTSDLFFRYQALSGMEVGLAVALGVGAIAAAGRGRLALAGVLAGLAVWNKLDGAAVIAAVAAAEAIHRRRVPVRFLAACAATCGPWFVWATWYFGSPVPQSLSAKLAGGEQLPFDRLWFLRFLVDGWKRYGLVLAPLALAIPGARELSASVTITALSAWALLHVLAYSVVDLGAPYPWYLAVPVAPLAALTGVTLGRAWGALAAAGRPRRLVAVVALGAVAVAVSLANSPMWWRTRSIQAWEAFEADRRLAGLFLRRYASPDEVLDSPFGWPAFESRLPTNDSSGLNSVQRREPVTYRIEQHAPGTDVPAVAADGMVRLATFNLANSRSPEWAWFTVVGRRDSAIATSPVRAVRNEDLRRLGDAIIVNAWRAHLGAAPTARTPAR